MNNFLPVIYNSSTIQYSLSRHARSGKIRPTKEVLYGYEIGQIQGNPQDKRVVFLFVYFYIEESKVKGTVYS